MPTWMRLEQPGQFAQGCIRTFIGQKRRNVSQEHLAIVGGQGPSRLKQVRGAKSRFKCCPGEGVGNPGILGGELPCLLESVKCSATVLQFPTRKTKHLPGAEIRFLLAGNQAREPSFQFFEKSGIERIAANAKQIIVRLEHKA